MTRYQRLPAAVLLAGVLFAVARVPHAVWLKRTDEIGTFRTLGDAGYYLRLIDRSGRSARVLVWLRDHTPADCVVLYRGQEKGAFEFAAPVLFPRLLVWAPAVPAEATTYAGRAIARGALPDGGDPGILILEGAVDHLALAVRP